MSKFIKIKRLDNNEVVHTVEVTGKSERYIDKVSDGMMINLDHDEYWIDDTCPEEANPLNKEVG